MELQDRNFRDFVQLYNKITEVCFLRCADNFFNRNVSAEEELCLDKCLRKFTRVNQRIMNVYVEVQTEINERRLIELESLTKEQQAKISATLGSNNLTSDNQSSNSDGFEKVNTPLSS